MKILGWVFKIILGVMLLALPIWIYLAFFANEPVFGPEQDVELGRQSTQAILEDPNIIILSRQEYPEAYAHLDRVVSEVLMSSAIRYGDVFPYKEMRIIHDDDVLNAFCTPGGFIYVYSGLIRYLEAEDHLAGVLGHEIAHAELRHSSLRLQKEYGVRKLLDFIILTNPMTIGDLVSVSILKDLSENSYSRDQEADADAWSVRYLQNTRYACDATAGFFVKMLENGDNVSIPEILSDHPDSAARIAAIRAEVNKLGCNTQLSSQVQWKGFQGSLPDPAGKQD